MSRFNDGDSVWIFVEVAGKKYPVGSGKVTKTHPGFYEVDVGPKSKSCVGGTIKITEKNLE